MDYYDQMQSTMGLNGLLNIVVSLICIGFSWWVLQSLRLEAALKNPRSAQAKLLQVFLSVALGYQIARFIIDYFQWSSWLPGMF
ncbi:DUF1146 family protein [Paenibacillus ginsengihumi]|uniref:DUF1146 family protein n=1 Tax=Paenibacillus ginsengihumi TaxID=431596 RepID=UPI00037CF382|nr:DUF1146 family protein [Paenibacillus ginsengihumi]